MYFYDFGSTTLNLLFYMGLPFIVFSHAIYSSLKDLNKRNL
jgi:hypothetical protein